MILIQLHKISSDVIQALIELQHSSMKNHPRFSILLKTMDELIISGLDINFNYNRFIADFHTLTSKTLLKKFLKSNDTIDISVITQNATLLYNSEFFRELKIVSSILAKCRTKYRFPKIPENFAFYNVINFINSIKP